MKGSNRSRKKFDDNFFTYQDLKFTKGEFKDSHIDQRIDKIESSIGDIEELINMSIKKNENKQVLI